MWGRARKRKRKRKRKILPQSTQSTQRRKAEEEKGKI